MRKTQSIWKGTVREIQSYSLRKTRKKIIAIRGLGNHGAVGVIDL